MSKIKSRDTTIERLILKELKKRRITPFKYQPKMLGSPDFVFPKKKVVLFCDGDFWHGYQFEKRKPNLGEYWVKKISGNMRRDKKIRNKLRSNGWLVVRFWEHQIRNSPAKCVAKIQKKVFRSRMQKSAKV